MIVDNEKFQLMLARRAMSVRELLREAGIAPQVVGNIRNGRKLTTKCIGKICKALACDPSDLVVKEVR